MYGFNEVRLVGTLVNDIKLKDIANGQKVCNLRLKVTKSRRDKNSGEKNHIINYFNIICWEKIAEYASRNLNKYDDIFIVGELSSFTPKQTLGNEQRSSITEIKALKIYPLMNSKKDDKESVE